ncbi:hypothetical protein [Bradyrhizobium sp.]|jgi:hypothetical protein|uniref:hypothetical protein n=1 Tax=Bradyrhizobium sp. TaxID=376 RepID=UPI003BAF9A80
MATRRGVRYPAGADRKLLKTAHARTIKELETRFAAAHKTFLRDSEHKARALDKSMALLNVDRDQVKRAVGKQFASNFAYVRKTRRPPKRPLLRGHNPTRYAPYDFSWSGKNCGGIAICSTYGPNATNGEVGLDLGIYEAGGAAGGAYVGDWFFSQSEDTWSVSVQASVWGRALIEAAFGYASAYAGLQLFVREDSTDETFVITTDIYNNSADGFGFDLTNVDAYYSAQLYIPVHANTWYEVWGGAVQHAYAGGAIAGAACNFDMFIAPIVASGVVIF